MYKYILNNKRKQNTSKRREALHMLSWGALHWARGEQGFGKQLWMILTVSRATLNYYHGLSKEHIYLAISFVSHSLLINKLQSLMVIGVTVCWVATYKLITWIFIILSMTSLLLITSIVIWNSYWSFSSIFLYSKCSYIKNLPIIYFYLKVKWYLNLHFFRLLIYRK